MARTGALAAVALSDTAPAADAPGGSAQAADALAGLTARTYVASPLHGAACAWVEKNCYADVWIGVLQALGLQPLAVMPFLVTLDFLGDQWTFFKPPHDELREAYGIEVLELNVWRPLLDHALEHLAAGRLLSTEVDAHWLPDTAGTDYRRSHTKTTIVLTAVDAAARRARYFHNTGLHELEGDDWRAIFEPASAPDATTLPLYAELIVLDRVRRLPDDALRALAHRSLERHLAWRPTTNPVSRFAARVERDLAAMHGVPLGHYHAWAFATLRQLGAGFELAAACLRWLEGDASASCASGPDAAAHAAAPHARAAAAMQRIGDGAKTLILKGARAVNARRALGADPLLHEMAGAWSEAMNALDGLAARSL